jgi:hypothetical protein
MPHQEILSFISTSLQPLSSTTIFNSGSTSYILIALFIHRSIFL